MDGKKATEHAENIVKSLTGLVGEIEDLAKKSIEKLSSENAVEFAEIIKKGKMHQGLGNISKDLAKMKDALKDL